MKNSLKTFLFINKFFLKTLFLAAKQKPTHKMLHHFMQQCWEQSTTLQKADFITKQMTMILVMILATVAVKNMCIIADAFASCTAAFRSLLEDAGKILEKLAGILDKIRKDIEDEGETNAMVVSEAKRVAMTDEELANQYLAEVETLNVTSAIDGTVFYSGPGNRALAETFAKENNYTTLELTNGGSYLNKQNLFDKFNTDINMAKKPWVRLSQRYAEQAQGKVYVFAKGASKRGIFNQIELPALKENLNVSEIIYK